MSEDFSPQILWTTPPTYSRHKISCTKFFFFFQHDICINFPGLLQILGHFIVFVDNARVAGSLLYFTPFSQQSVCLSISLTMATGNRSSRDMSTAAAYSASLRPSTRS